jgi:NADH-quinone oxidoreductase subunit J
MNEIFFTSAAVAVIASIMVITRRNAIHALLYLVLSLLSVAGVFYTLGAAYAAVLEIIIYAGAIVILFVFVVMMLNINQSSKDEKESTSLKFWIVPVFLTLILIGEFCYAFFDSTPNTMTVQAIGAKEVGISLFTEYLLVVELAGILLLAGIVGAYHLGRTKKRNLHRYNLPQDYVEDSKK